MSLLVEQFSLMIRNEGVDHNTNVAVDKIVEIVPGQIDAVIGDASLRKIVSADAFGAVAGAYLTFTRLGLLVVLFLHHRPSIPVFSTWFPTLESSPACLCLGCFLLLEGYPWTSFLMVLIVFTVTPVLDSLFLPLHVLGKKLGLAPVVVILAILAFGSLFGFLGVLLAIPATAAGKVLLVHALEAYRRSRFFTGPEATYNKNE